MCGLFGYVATGDETVDVDRLARIAAVTERRGRHAFGFAWLDRRGRLRCFKRPGPITEHLSLLAMARDAVMLIGHTRYATQGDPAENINNHPHPCDGGWIVHNGMIPNYREIQEADGFHAVTDCDSEVIAQLVETRDGRRIERLAAALGEFANGAAVMGLWASELIVARRGNPLHVGRNTRGVWLASLAEGLPVGATMARDDRILRYTRKGGEVHVEKTDIGEAGEPAGAGAAAVRARGPERARGPALHAFAGGLSPIGRTRPRFERSGFDSGGD